IAKLAHEEGHGFNARMADLTSTSTDMHRSKLYTIASHRLTISRLVHAAVSGGRHVGALEMHRPDNAQQTQN
ncbi:hypothetical protein Ciccas_008011, partial [Cichlidogyrus casuarinus]